MRRLTYTTTATIMLAAAIILMTCCGVLSGLHRQWVGMGLCFFLTAYIARFCVVIPLIHRIELRFMQLGELVADKSEWGPVVPKLAPHLVGILMAILFVVVFFLSLFACHSEHWLALCIFLTVLLIANSISAASIVLVAVKACCGHVEELVSKNKEGVGG